MYNYFHSVENFQTHLFETDFIACEFKYQIYTISDNVYVTIIFESDFLAHIMLQQMNNYFKGIGYSLTIISSRIQFMNNSYTVTFLKD